MRGPTEDLLGPLCLALIFLVLTSPLASAVLVMGPEERVQAGGTDIEVPGYSVPSFVFWNGDSLKDLVVGEGSGSYPDSKVRIYLNIGTSSDPQFADYFYAQSEGSDLLCPGSG